MTDLTQPQRETLERAQGREGKTTPAPWEMFYNPYGKFEGVSGEWREVVSQYEGALIITNDDAELLTDAPALQDLAIAQAQIIAEQAARIAALEAEQTAIPTPRIQVYEGNTLGIGKRWFYSVHIGHVPVSNNHSAPTEAEAYECANKAIEYYLNRLTGKSSDWGSY